MKIELTALTTCGVQPDGETLEINFIDAAGVAVTLRVPFESAQAIAMTLPGLLTKAVRRITREKQSRYIFPLGRWRVESVGDGSCAIATLATADGFEVSFGIPPGTCRGLAWALREEADRIGKQEPSRADHPAVRLN